MLETFVSCLTATTIQGGALFWIKPLIKSQYVYGGTLKDSFRFLKNDGGLLRFYRGFLPAILKSGIGRTSDITIYTEISKKYNNNNYFSSLLSGSLSAVVKIAILPLDTLSNVYQVHGADGYKHINGNLYRGALAYGAIQCISSSSWLLSYSKIKDLDLFENKNMNYLFTGFTCSLITDTIVNPIRVIKTNKQAFSTERSYLDIITNMIKDKEGSGFYRGYKTRLAYNAINGSLFVLLWQNLEMIASKGNKTK
jgi:hypothetical protein